MSPRIISAEEYQAREIELIDLAQDLVGDSSISSLNMDALVAAAPYSKGTIYKHFCSKEDLIVAICNECIAGVHAMFERSVQFDGSSRERIIAKVVAYIIWAKLNSPQLFVVFSAHSPTVVANASAKRNEQHNKIEKSLMSLFNAEIIMAVEQGDLQLKGSMKPLQVSFACWSSVFGAMALIMSKGESKELQSMMLERETMTNAQLLLDGFNWKPLSTEFDYTQTIKRVCKELHQDEIRELEKMGSPFNLL